MTNQQKRCLNRLADGPERRTRGPLNSWLGRDAHAIDECVAEGWITQERDPEQVRGRPRRWLRITREGMRALMESTPAADEFEP